MSTAWQKLPTAWPITHGTSEKTAEAFLLSRGKRPSTSKEIWKRIREILERDLIVEATI